MNTQVKRAKSNAFVKKSVTRDAVLLNTEKDRKGGGVSGSRKDVYVCYVFV